MQGVKRLIHTHARSEASHYLSSLLKKKLLKTMAPAVHGPSSAWPQQCMAPAVHGPSSVWPQQCMVPAVHGPSSAWPQQCMAPAVHGPSSIRGYMLSPGIHFVSSTYAAQFPALSVHVHLPLPVSMLMLIRETVWQYTCMLSFLASSLHLFFASEAIISHCCHCSRISCSPFHSPHNS